MKARTAIADKNRKLDIIDHLHQQHVDELLLVAQFYSGEENITGVSISDIYHEGVLLEIVTSSNTKEIFVAFTLTGETEENLRHLLYNALVSQKKSAGANQKHYFTVTGKQQISRDFIRLLVNSQSPLPEYYAEYCYGFSLGNEKPAGQQPSADPENLNKDKYKDVRLYTLRKSFRSSPSSSFPDQGEIDIFTHENSPGSQWAVSLKEGDVIFSCMEKAFRHDYLQQGEVVLVADEAAWPAAAGILEHWTNASAPTVIIISSNDDNQAYFPSDLLPAAGKVRRVICAVDGQGEKVIELLEKIAPVDAVWGAMEADVAALIRHYLRDQRGLTGRQNYLRGYWKLRT